MKKIWSVKGYLLFGLVCYLLVLIATAPLGFIWQYAKPHVGPLPVQVQQLSGSLWDGHAKISTPHIGPMALDWQLSLPGLLLGSARFTLAVTANELTLEGGLELSPSSIRIEDAKALVASTHIDGLLRPMRAHVTGHFEVDALGAYYDFNTRQVSGAQGRLIYRGGEVRLPIDNRIVQSELPMLIGEITQPNDKVEVQILTADGVNLGSAYLQADGWGGVSVRRRLLDLLGQKWPGQATEDTVIFEVSEKVL